MLVKQLVSIRPPEPASNYSKYVINELSVYCAKGHGWKVKASCCREKNLSCMFITQRRKSCLFLTLIKRKMVRRMYLLTPCMTMTMSTSQKTWERSPAYTIQCKIDYTKGGGDVLDLLSTIHSTRIKSRKWPLNENALAFILDTHLSLKRKNHFAR